jgi:hypothetical protein
MHSKKYFDTAEAEKDYPVSGSYLEKLRVHGGGPDFFRCGRRVFYERTSFEAWLERRRCSNTSEG